MIHSYTLYSHTTHTHTHVDIPKHMHACMHTRTLAHTHTRMHAWKHARMHAHTEYTRAKCGNKDNAFICPRQNSPVHLSRCLCVHAIIYTPHLYVSCTTCLQATREKRLIGGCVNCQPQVTCWEVYQLYNEQCGDSL